MAYYAKISNQEFTVSEYARLREAQQEKNVIEVDNRASDGYVALINMCYSKNTSDTLEGLQAELNALYSDRENPPAQEDVDAINVAIQAEKDTLAEEGADLVSQMETLEAEGTEALVTEIENLNTAIANALCRVTAMYTGVDEIVMKAGDSSAIQEEINALEESKKEVDYTQDEEVVKAELQAIQDQISAKLEEMRAVPQVEFDNSVYWEGYYGGCKRTSYNTQGGVHKLGGTPFRKNYAGVGYIYDPVRDAFYSEQPYASWTLDESTCYWQPPTPRPEGMDWHWNEATLEWIDKPGYKYYSNWIYDEDIQNWIPPVAKPNDGCVYEWYQETLEWLFIYSTSPYPSWIWNTETKIWEAPTPKPNSDSPFTEYTWNEETLTWEKR